MGITVEIEMYGYRYGDREKVSETACGGGEMCDKEIKVTLQTAEIDR